jgi:hypothetical protein
LSAVLKKQAKHSSKCGVLKRLGSESKIVKCRLCGIFFNVEKIGNAINFEIWKKL